MKALPLWVWVILGGLAYVYCTSVAHMLVTRWAYQLKRHNLVIAARRRRLEYEREQMLSEAVEVEDEQPQQFLKPPAGAAAEPLPERPRPRQVLERVGDG